MVGAIASILIVVLASYAVTKTAIKYYKSGRFHRANNSSRSNSSLGSYQVGTGRSDGHHFQQLTGIENTSQMMLDELLPDDDGTW